MTAEDLQCKDWILNNLSKTYEQVGDINLFEDKIYAGREENEWYHWELDSGEFLPIPITLDILEKNGFDVDEDCGVFVKDGCRIISDTDCISITCGIYTTVTMPCKYVHELQHLLRLCGIKKEIEL